MRMIPLMVGDLVVFSSLTNQGRRSWNVFEVHTKSFEIRKPTDVDWYAALFIGSSSFPNLSYTGTTSGRIKNRSSVRSHDDDLLGSTDIMVHDDACPR
jgi:hypothetical protein